MRDLAKTFRAAGREVAAVQGVTFEVFEMRLPRWRPEYRGRA